MNVYWSLGDLEMAKVLAIVWSCHFLSNPTTKYLIKTGIIVKTLSPTK